MDYQALKTELLAGHPVTGAYDADDALAADQLNAVNVPAQKEVISASDIFETIDSVDFDALSADEKSKLQIILNLGDAVRIGPTSRTRAMLMAIFGAGTDTRTNLVAAVSETVSRAVDLGLGDVVIGDVQNARAL